MGELEEIIKLTGQVAAVDATTRHLERGQQDIRRDLEEKHKENRHSIHDLRDNMQSFMDDMAKRMSKIEVKVAVGSAFGGLLFALGAHLIDKWLK